MKMAFRPKNFFACGALIGRLRRAPSHLISNPSHVYVWYTSQWACGRQRRQTARPCSHTHEPRGIAFFVDGLVCIRDLQKCSERRTSLGASIVENWMGPPQVSEAKERAGGGRTHSC